MQELTLTNKTNAQEPTIPTTTQKIHTYYDARAVVRGVKKRCRREEYHGLDIGTFPIEPMPKLDEITFLVKKAILDKMRVVNQATVKVVLNYVEEEPTNSNGFTVKKWQPFSDKNIIHHISLGGGNATN